MKNAQIIEKCNCPLECEAITYDYEYVSTPFDPDVMCPNLAGKANLMKDYYDNPLPSKMSRNMMAYFNFSPPKSDSDVCKHDIQFRAMVIFRLATDTMTVTTTSRRLSFFDKLSSFGKKNHNSFIKCA